MVGKNIKIIVLAGVLIVIFILASVFLPDEFLTLRNFQSMSSQIPEFGLLAIAMMIAMISGGIDLSVVSTATISGIAGAYILKKFINAQTGSLQVIYIIAIAILAILIVSVICGYINGFLIAYLGVTPILATLGTMGFYLGLSIVLTKAQGIIGFHEKFLFIGNGTISIIPVPMIIFIVCVLAVALFLNKTRLGYTIYMLGTSPGVSRFSGIKNSAVIIKTYMITGLIAGLASIIIISRVNSAKPGYGSSYLLQAIMVAVLGGADPSGGFGTMIGLVIAIIMVQIVQSCIVIISTSPTLAFFKMVVWGLLLLLVMAINYYVSIYQQRPKKIKTPS